jgi:hypothetical protein
VSTNVLYRGLYRRDLEIAVLLNAMVDAGLALTVLLDYCYSGGFITRGDERTRGIEEVYVSQPAINTPDNMEEIALIKGQ